VGREAAAEQLTFVSVTFEAEMPLMHLQARSLARFLPERLVHEIVVIDNSRAGLGARARTRLLAEYRHLAHLVRIVRPDAIVDVPDTIGWLRQQVLKLSVAAAVSTPHYLVLDAKNHLVAEPTIDEFVTDDGRVRVHAHQFRTHSLRPHLERVLEYVGLPPEPYLDRFTSTVTPFVFDTASVGAMIAAIESHAQRPFAEEFVAHQLTEFFLYSAWLAAEGEGWDATLQLDAPPSPVVWPGTRDVGSVRSAIEAARSRRSPFFAVHRRALAKVDGAGARALADYWTELGLFGSRAEAIRFIWAFRLNFVLRQSWSRLRRWADGLLARLDRRA
jgi:hypothetical protein